MFDLFDFDLPGAVTEQLERRLQAMASSGLTEQALLDLARFQEQHKLTQGVYQLLLGDEAVYVGKATDAKERLEQHFRKLRGRQGIILDQVRFRCLLLHPNWSTSAHEDLLVAHYKAQGQCKWNNSGFGPKDVGRERDGTEPNWFDREYPINAEYPCSGIADALTVGEVLQSLKRQLPFVFRYEVPNAGEASKQLDLGNTPRNARALLDAVVIPLGAEWQATIFRSHMILYKERRDYRHAVTVIRKRGQ